MARFLMLWSLDKSLIPADPKERGDGWALLMAMVRQDMEKGITKDWGVFPAEGAGYCVMEGSNVEVMSTAEQYAPYVDFETRPVATADEADALIKNLSG